MKFKILPLILMIFTLASCGKTEFAKKHQAHWQANGATLTCTEDHVYASYDNNDNTKLNITTYASSDQSNALYMQIDLNKLNQDVIVVRPNSNYSYAGSTSANFYSLVSGKYNITGYSNSDPASRHAEGTFTFHFTKLNNPSDTINITEGYFYINNY